MSVIIVQATFIMAAAILVEAALAIVGAGVPRGDAAWGSMISEAFERKEQSFLAMFWPGLAISLTSLSYNLVGDGLRDAFGLDRGRGYGARGRLGLTQVQTGGRPGRRPGRRPARVEVRHRPTPEPGAVPGPAPLLSVEGLSVEFVHDGVGVPVVEDVSFAVGAGEVVGLVGESGSGKTVTSLAIMRLIPSPPGRITAGRVDFDGRPLLDLSFREMRAVRGRELAMIFQDPMSSLNPAFTVGDQIAEAVRLHEGLSARAAHRRALEMLDHVGIPAARRRVRQYPHQFSGGMRQRVMIAMALACRPRLLIADEPTTALDVTVQAQILELLRELRREMGLSVIVVTHDLGVVADICDRVLVMYAGQIVETADVEPLFRRPTHPYTEGLLRAMPRVDGGAPIAIGGRVPPAGQYPVGCRFHPRCPYAREGCRVGPVPLVAHAGSLTRCVRAHELVLGGAAVGEVR
jgi:oligopeptide/dipeptide ABC transporter ATP-binding protein